MNDALNKFKAEMEKRGLFRKITVAANKAAGYNSEPEKSCNERN